MLAVVLLFSLVAQYIITQGYKVTVQEVDLEVRGGTLNMEVYRPTNFTQGEKFPCMILAHGGSECLATPVIHAWEYAKRGIVVINVNMYGAGLSDMPQYMEDGATVGTYSRNSGTHGLVDALNYARTIDYVDNTRIGIWGHSQGYTVGCTAAVFDGACFTLNDRLLNVLYDEFGVEISEADLTRNADDIAAEKLDEADLALYNYRRGEVQEIVDNYVCAVRVMEMSCCNQKVMVAGHEVIRNPQCNMQFGGETRGGACGPFVNGGSPSEMAIFCTDEPVADNSWYSVPDYTVDQAARSTLLGGVYDVTVNNSEELKSAIENRSAYFFFNPVIHHNGNLWAPKAVTKTIEFFTQCLRYNNGELSDPATQPISTLNLTSSYVALAFAANALYAMLIALCALASILTKTAFFADSSFAPYESKLSKKSKAFWVAAILAVITAFVGGYVSSRENIALNASNKFMSDFLPTEPGQFRLFFQIVATAATAFILFGIMALINKKKENNAIPAFSALNVGIGFKKVMKNVLLAFLLFAAMYAAAAVLKSMSCMRFVFVDGSFELMQPYAFTRMLRYFIFLVPFTLVISMMNNLTVVKDASDAGDTAIAVFWQSIGAWLFVVVAYIIVFGPGTQTVMGSVQANMGIQTILPLLAMVPICNYLYRRLFKVTGSVWAGAVFVAIILAWRLSAFTSHRFMFWEYSGTLARFFGF